MVLSYDGALNKLTQLEIDYRRKRLILNESRQMVDLCTLKEHEIVGLTTHGVARLQASLSALHAPIGK